MDTQNIKYPIGVQDFVKLRLEGYTYIDKTSLVYKLVHMGVPIFLARPRHFGKSLFLSTLKAYFEGEKELFEGLAIYELEKEWTTRPVFLLSLARYNRCDPNGLNNLLSTTFQAGIPYELARGKDEIYFENNLYLLFNLVGINTSAEYRTSRGRIDLLVTMPKYLYVMELKLEGTPLEALSRINEKGYADQFATDPRTLFKVGINFSKVTRNIDTWIIEEVTKD